VEALAPLKVGLLHGKLKPGEKAESMRAFVARETQVAGRHHRRPRLGVDVATPRPS